jgi:branched-subunit amino acid transport protein
VTATIWVTIVGCALVTAVIKGIGPVALGGRALPARLSGVVVLMAPALLAALVVTSALADGDHLRIGADTVGVAAGGVVLLLRRPLLLAALVAVVVTATLRLSGVLG